MVSEDLDNLSSSSQVIDRLEAASGKLRTLPPDVKTASVLEMIVGEVVPAASVDENKSALPTGSHTDKRRRTPSAKSTTNTVPKKSKN